MEYVWFQFCVDLFLWYAKVFTWLFYRLYIQKHHDQSLCVWPNQCHDVSYDLLFNDWRSGCNIINLFTLFELKYFKQNKITIYAKLFFSYYPINPFFGKITKQKYLAIYMKISTPILLPLFWWGREYRDFCNIGLEFSVRAYQLSIFLGWFFRIVIRQIKW